MEEKRSFGDTNGREKRGFAATMSSKKVRGLGTSDVQGERK